MDVQDFRLEISVIQPYYEVIVHCCPPLFPPSSLTVISTDVSAAPFSSPLLLSHRYLPPSSAVDNSAGQRHQCARHSG